MRDGAVNRRSSAFFEKLAFEKESERRAVGGLQLAIIQLKHIPFMANNRCQLRAGASTGCHRANGRRDKAPL